MSEDAVSLLERDHREIERLFAEANADGANLDRIAISVAQALLVHTEIEEKIFYPAARERARETSNLPLFELVGEARREHTLVKQLLHRLSGARGKPLALRAVLWSIEKTVMLHVTEEEKLTFPLSRRALDETELRVLGDRMARIKASRPAA